MTLSGFLREYLYIPMGGGRVSTTRRYTNLMTVMLLGGLWHGAGWTFVAWGALHGFYLCLNRFWRDIRARNVAARRIWATNFVCWLVTFSAVVFAWVFFRASSFAGALNVLAGMAGQAGLYLPHGLEPAGYRMPLSEMAQAIAFTGLAYAIALAIVAGLIAWVVFDHRAQLRVLEDLERAGVTRRSAAREEVP